MKRFWLLSGIVLAFLLAAFLIFETLGIALLQNPLPHMRANPAASALIGFSLLAADSVIPVPASIIMIAHGAIFGLVPGTLISLAGSVTSSLSAFAIGRAGRGAYERILDESEVGRAREMLRSWGTIAIIASRPVPLLAETVGIMAGATGTNLAKFLAASVLGNTLPAVLYAWAGATGGGGVGVWPFVVVLLISGSLFLVGRRTRPSESAN